VATELVQGLPLNDYVKTHLTGLRQIARWVADLADALQAAHSAGIVHRDLKPLNVVIASDGRPTLIDFGMASLVSAYQGQHRHDGSGTYPFIAPEQAQRSADADHRVDVFGLGALLKYLLTGEGPYSGAESAYQAALDGEPRGIDKVTGPALRRSLCRIANKALEADPADRFRNAREMAVAIRRALRRRALIATGFGAVGLVAAVAIVLATAGPTTADRGAAEDAAPEAAAEEPAAPAEDASSGAPAEDALPQWRALIVHVQKMRREAGQFALTPETVPVLYGDRIRISVNLPRPLYAYVLFISTDKPPKLVYPAGGESPGPVEELHVPALDRWLPMRGPTTTETVCVLAGEEPIADAEAAVARLAADCRPPELHKAGIVLCDGVHTRLVLSKRAAAVEGGKAIDWNGLDAFLRRASGQCEFVRAIVFPVLGEDDTREWAAKTPRGRRQGSGGEPLPRPSLPRRGRGRLLPGPQ
jgi:hypothetical protein